MANEWGRVRRHVRSHATETVQQVLRRSGYEIRRSTPSTSPSIEDARLARLLRNERIDSVLDVGANVGQYARRLRELGYGREIVSFEPLAHVYAELERQAAPDPRWHTHRLALADIDGHAEMHITAESMCSSLLEIGERHIRAAPAESMLVGSETVTLAQLDTMWNRVVTDATRPFLKIDVQGFELRVLRGADAHLDRLAGLQVELSFVELYEGDSPWRTVADHLESRGFKLVGLEPAFEDPASGDLLQADAFFVRANVSAVRSSAN